jgi:hypothetical protein
MTKSCSGGSLNAGKARHIEAAIGIDDWATRSHSRGPAASSCPPRRLREARPVSPARSTCRICFKGIFAPQACSRAQHGNTYGRYRGAGRTEITWRYPARIKSARSAAVSSSLVSSEGRKASCFNAYRRISSAMRWKMVPCRFANSRISPGSSTAVESVVRCGRHMAERRVNARVLSWRSVFAVVSIAWTSALSLTWHRMQSP